MSVYLVAKEKNSQIFYSNLAGKAQDLKCNTDIKNKIKFLEYL